MRKLSIFFWHAACFTVAEYYSVTANRQISNIEIKFVGLSDDSQNTIPCDLLVFLGSPRIQKKCPLNSLSERRCLFLLTDALGNGYVLG